VSSFIEHYALQLLTLFEQWGLWGVFILMFIESSLVPFPSELVMVPAGILVAKGKMSMFPAILAGTAGSLGGAYFNYYLASLLGKPFLKRYGKYLFLPPKKLDQACEFFDRHGAFGTFTCRFIPGIRQLISLPAGLARLSHAKFSACTTAGAGLWVSFLAILGYWFGDQVPGNDLKEVIPFSKTLAKTYSPHVLAIVLLLFVLYFVYLKFLGKESNAGNVAVDAKGKNVSETGENVSETGPNPQGSS
jgi:membrane protein DedA with SNARE-associated domain